MMASLVRECRNLNSACRGECGSMSCASQACLRAFSTSLSPARTIAGSSVQSNCRPSTAAAATTSDTCGPSSMSRRRTDSAIDVGTPVVTASFTCQPPSPRTSSPEDTASARISSTAKGSPSLSASNRRMIWLGADRCARHAATICSTSAASSRGTSMTVAARRACTALIMSCASDGSVSRSVATHSTRSLVMLSARYSTIATDSGSANWRSSSTSTVPLPPRSDSSRRTASPRISGDISAALSPGWPQSGTIEASALRYSATAGRSFIAVVRATAIRASMNGLSGTGLEACTALPQMTV